MGIYVFETTFLIEQLQRDAADPNSSHDFGKDIIPVSGQARQSRRASLLAILRAPRASEAKPTGATSARSTPIGRANIDLTDVVPELDLYDRDWPIWTYGEITPPAKFVHDVDGRRGLAVSSLVSGGCIVSGASINRSLLFTGVHVHSYSTIDEAVILPYARSGATRGCSKVVIDRGVRHSRTGWWSARIPSSTPSASGAPTTA